MFYGTKINLSGAQRAHYIRHTADDFGNPQFYTTCPLRGRWLQDDFGTAVLVQA